MGPTIEELGRGSRSDKTNERGDKGKKNKTTKMIKLYIYMYTKRTDESWSSHLHSITQKLTLI